MATFLIITLAAMGVVLMIVMLGLLLAQLLINRADKAQTCANIISEQQQEQGIVVDLDELPDAQHQPGMTVISNDVIEGTTHRHHHLNKKTISVIDHYAPSGQTNIKNISRERINTYKNPTIPIKTDSNAISSDISIVNPLTDKITLDY
jgi:hypothetical protein